ncbi:MAG TPA: hypothetical protein VF898_10745, partial [Chloroflexota bacterium]
MKSRVACSVLMTAVFLAPWTWTARAMTTGVEPEHGTWTMAPGMPVPVTSQQAVMLHDGRVLVLGGEMIPGLPVPWAELYDPSSRTWSAAEDMHEGRIAESVTVLRDGRVLVLGGINHKLRDLDATELFNPATGAWSLLPSLPQARFSQSASLLPDGRVLVVGGIVDGAISRTTLLFDPSRERFLPGP